MNGGGRAASWWSAGDLARRDYVVGLLAGLPVAVPAPPFYLLAIAAFLLVIPTLAVPRRVWLLVALLVGLSLVSVVASPFLPRLGGFRSLYASLFFGLFLFGYGLRRPTAFFRGFLVASTALAVAVIVAFVVTGQLRAGLGVFVISTARLWGAGLFPDWPNYLAFSLGAAALLQVAVRDSWPWAGVCALGAVLTTSRTGMLAALVLGVLGVARLARRPRGRWLLAGALALLLAFGVGARHRIATQAANLQAVQSRILRSDDRLELYTFTWGLFRRHPWVGVGPIVLDDASLGAPRNSFHSAYLEVLVRQGVLGFAVWLALVLPLGLLRRPARPWWPLIGYFLVSSAANTLFKQPHIFMLYSAVLALALAGIPARAGHDGQEGLT